MKYQKLEESSPIPVFVDWDYAIAVCEKLDRPLEDRRPIQGRTAVRILAEYAAIAHRSAWPPDGVKLAVVVAPPSVWFCPSEHGHHGGFICAYDSDVFGTGIEFFKAGAEHSLFDYCSISARLDGWSFASRMISTHSKSEN
jgi:hypothetical protein